MDRTSEARVLSNLLKRGHRLERASFIKEFPERGRRDMEVAIERLARLGFVRSRVVGGKNCIELRPDRITDAMRWASPLGLGDSTYMSVEESIPKGYAKPFHVASGEHMVNGHVSRYAFCHSERNRHDVTCFVINAQNSARPIHLGDISDPNSFIAKFLAAIDQHFGDGRFTREAVKRSFPSELTGNNQPTKAAIEYLLHNAYLIRSDYSRGPSRFERTLKQRSVASLGVAEARKDINYREQTIMYSFYQ